MFGLALFLDVNEYHGAYDGKKAAEMGVEHTGAIVEDLMDTTLSAYCAIEDNKHVKTPFARSKTMKKDRKMLCSVHSELDNWVLKDHFSLWCRISIFGTSKFIASIMSTRHWLLDENPFRAGMMEYAASMQVNWWGQCVERDSRYIFVMAHVYNACRLANNEMPHGPIWSLS